MSAETVGIVGVGNMGGAMALRLRELGHAVAVRDLRPEAEAVCVAAGASAHPTPASLARHCALVIVCVVDAAQTREVLFGAEGVVQGLAPGGTVMLCPTIAPEDVAEAASALAARGLHWLDAPMSGGPARARDGTMSLMVATEDATWARWQPLLAQLAARLFRVGTRPGDGARTKLVNNLLAAINLAGAAEALRLADALGLDAARTLDVIEQSSGQSWIGSDRARRVLAGDAAPRAHMTLLAKDSALAMAAAATTGLTLPVAGRAAEAFARACRGGLADADDSALWRGRAVD
ncbi:NAD(P)-dependent oxidoreductase [Rubrivivax albus]|uniref:NAD(P)-dependent oxidoreductase n=1 Tax=Rubrivivax albus TaxID=2499835 RepID=A0A437JYC5_9BURK|nr:NAD(P)-dependent oxidoreductase [Rubrivivax albus]RVT52666.1 NAD(P)-dependent oxidoreductase [Rubrivivax albus]